MSLPTRQGCDLKPPSASCLVLQPTLGFGWLVTLVQCVPQVFATGGLSFEGFVPEGQNPLFSMTMHLSAYCAYKGDENFYFPIICTCTTSTHAASLSLAFIFSEGFLRWAHVAHVVQAALELTM